MLQVKKTRTGALTLTLEQVKLFLKVDGTADDTLITALIEQALDLIEEYLNVSVYTTEIEVLATARFRLELPYGPVTTITSVKDADGTDVEYTWNGFYILFEPTTYSPTTPEAAPYVETITIYEAEMDAVPKGLELAWLEVIAWLYENRGDTTQFAAMLSQNANLQVYRNKVWI